MKNILILTVDCWNTNIGANSSYTYANLFSSMKEYQFSNVYIREELPNDPCCKRYFQISENKIIKSMFNRKIKTGREVNCDAEATEKDLKNISEHQNLYNIQRSRFYYVKKIIRELIWLLAPWKSNELDNFIDSVKPDVVIFAMEGYIHFNRICRYVLKRTAAKGIGYFWDDCFTYKQTVGNMGRRFLRFFQRISLKKLVKYCSAFWAITEKTKNEADAFFGIDCQIMTKPIDFEPDEVWEPYSIHKPIKILYTGNLMIGRFDVIKEVSSALVKLNKDSVKAELDIYSQSYIPQDEIEGLSPFVKMNGAVPQEKVSQLQQQADVLLFAEAISGKNSVIARLSFSTKLTDYLRSGKCIFAIGSSDIAPIEYLRKERAALCASNSEEIYSCLRQITEDSNLINMFAQNAFECGVRNHSRQVIQQKIDSTFSMLELM